MYNFSSLILRKDGTQRVPTTLNYNVPVLVPNRSISKPNFWSMLSKRLHAGKRFPFNSGKTLCSPCWNPPPARRRGRFLVE